MNIILRGVVVGMAINFFVLAVATYNNLDSWPAPKRLAHIGAMIGCALVAAGCGKALGMGRGGSHRS